MWLLPYTRWNLKKNYVFTKINQKNNICNLKYTSTIFVRYQNIVILSERSIYCLGQQSWQIVHLRGKFKCFNLCIKCYTRWSHSPCVWNKENYNITHEQNWKFIMIIWLDDWFMTGKVLCSGPVWYNMLADFIIHWKGGDKTDKSRAGGKLVNGCMLG